MNKISQNIQIALVIVALLWLVYMVNLVLPLDLRLYGLRPRRIDSLWGIAFMPFLHSGFDHLIANTGALLVLLSVSLSFSRKLTFVALLMIMLVGGAFVWLLGKDNTVHIGASGIIFGLIGFLMFLGIFRGEWKALVLSMAVCFFYGGALFSLLYHTPGISWTGHFFGFLTGVLAAWWMRAEKET